MKLCENLVKTSWNLADSVIEPRGSKFFECGQGERSKGSTWLQVAIYNSSNNLSKFFSHTAIMECRFRTFLRPRSFVKKLTQEFHRVESCPKKLKRNLTQDVWSETFNLWKANVPWWFTTGEECNIVATRIADVRECLANNCSAGFQEFENLNFRFRAATLSENQEGQEELVQEEFVQEELVQEELVQGPPDGAPWSFYREDNMEVDETNQGESEDLTGYLIVIRPWVSFTKDPS